MTKKCEDCGHSISPKCWCQENKEQAEFVAANKSVIEPAVEPVGHVHAALMALYAEDAAKTAEPWKLWQYKQGEQWGDFTSRNPDWEKVRAYRRKPVPTTKTVWVNLYSSDLVNKKIFYGVGCDTLEKAEASAGNFLLTCVQIEVPV